jgi:hypothetical protein
MGDFEQISEPGLALPPGEGLGPDVTLADFARTGRISQDLAGSGGSLGPRGSARCRFRCGGIVVVLGGEDFFSVDPEPVEQVLHVLG